MRIKIYFLTLLLCLILSNLTCNAVSLDATAMNILTGSPSFMADSYSLESAIKELKTASNLPDPEIGGEYLFAPVSEDNRWAAEINWSVEWPGVYGARAREADSKMIAASLRSEMVRIERLIEIKTLLLNYIQCRKKMTLLEELSSNNDTIYRMAESSAKGGEMTILDLNKVKLEYANIRGTMASLMDEEASVISSLSQIYGKDCTPLLKNMDWEFPEITVPIFADLSLMIDHSPYIILAGKDIETARHARKVAKMEALPSLSIGYKHAYEEETHFNGALVGISIPLFSSRGKQKAAKAEIMAAQSQAETSSQEIKAEAEATLKRLQILVEQINEISPIIDNADYNATLLKAYEGGLITLIEYLTDRNYFTTAAIDLVNLRYTAALTQLSLQKYFPL